MPKEIICRDPKLGGKHGWSGERKLTEAQEDVAKAAKEMFEGRFSKKKIFH